MFQAVRNWLSRRSASVQAGHETLAARGLVSLFGFELAVVLTGVLAAQFLYNWYNEAKEADEMHSAMARLNEGAVDVLNMTYYWEPALPCLRERVQGIMQDASRGNAIPTAYATRPTFRISRMEPPSDEAMLEMREHYDDELVESYFELIDRSARQTRLVREIGAQWGRFALLDQSHGTPGPGDAAAVRLAGSEILANLRSIEIQVEEIRLEVAALNSLLEENDLPGIPERTDASLPQPLGNCDDMWELNQIFRAPGAMSTDP